jgi:hypothetical protein
MNLPTIKERKRFRSPTVTPQALAWDGKQLWMSSRDVGFLYKVRVGLASNSGDSDKLEIVEQADPPGVVWAAVANNGAMYVTIGKGLNDDRYVYRYDRDGFSKLFACPDLTGSYLSFDGENLYLSQWYEQRILKMDSKGKVAGKIDIGAEICGHVFANGALYVLRGTENVPRPQYAGGKPTPERFKSGAKEGEEQWWISRLNPGDKALEVTDIAKVPFAARSLTFDGENFWSNHRAANETVCFSLPN